MLEANRKMNMKTLLILAALALAAGWLLCHFLASMAGV
jgi:hypothetical protein